MLLHVHHHKRHEHLALSANPIAFAHDTLLERGTAQICIMLANV